MMPEESINAATINAAWAMGLEKETGSISKGKLGNVIITRKMNNLALIPYHFGANPVKHTIIKGKII